MKKDRRKSKPGYCSGCGQRMDKRREYFKVEGKMESGRYQGYLQNGCQKCGLINKRSTSMTELELTEYTIKKAKEQRQMRGMS